MFHALLAPYAIHFEDPAFVGNSRKWLGMAALDGRSRLHLSSTNALYF